MEDNINWDSLKSEFKKSVRIEKNLDSRTIKIKFLNEDLIDNELIGIILKNKNGLQNSLKYYKNINIPIKYDLEINKKKNIVKLVFFEEKIIEKVYDFLEDFFHGNLLKEMVEALFGAFGRYYRKE